MTRTELWQRMLDKNYFDWCRRAQLKKLEDLFSGVVDENPEDYIVAVELFFHPLQTVENWQMILCKLSFSIDEYGEPRQSQELLDTWVSENLDYLWQRDFQYSGMSIEKQLELSEFLGFENLKADRENLLIDSWLKNIIAWLTGEYEEEWDASGFADSKFAAGKSFFYKVLDGAPLEFRDKKFFFVAEKFGWYPNSTIVFSRLFKELIKIICSYKVPRKLKCDHGPRVKFVEGIREDLESGTAPKLFIDIWSAFKK